VEQIILDDFNCSRFVLFFRREALGQTKATTINYLKNIRSLFHNVLRSYIYEHTTFPRLFDGTPCPDTVTKMKLLEQKLDLIYVRKTKQQPAELFLWKTEEAKDLPDYADVVACLSKIRDGIPEQLVALEKHFSTSPSGPVTIRSEKTGTPAEKTVSVLALDPPCSPSLTVLFSRFRASGGS